MDDIKYDDNSKCEFDSLEDTYNALFEESLKIKTKKLKVNNTSLRINVVNDLLKFKNANPLDEILALKSEKNKIKFFNKVKFIKSEYNLYLREIILYL